ncbi:MAG TPA: D-2-hydroxyacid dehydrogenase [Candidatus Limnocylindrales bacterium]|nr:D-2-hydroxyacid dehydrogenase [Candidatus Limnocylindrales bacterium]
MSPSSPQTQRLSGPGSGPGGVPAAIGLSPILSARYRQQDVERIAAAAPGSRLVNVSMEGHADSDLDDVEVLLRGPLPMAVFDRLLLRSPRLMWVHSATAGVERVLTPLALERGLAITNARGVFSDPIAEYVLMWILAVSRRLPLLLELQKERTWQPLEGREMADVTVGIVGLGSIGRRVAEIVLTMGGQVVATKRRADFSDATPDEGDEDGIMPLIDLLPADGLPELMARSDFVVLALPLTPETENTVDAELLAHAKPGAWLINIARGALVDDRELIRAIREGRLGGAVLDAFREEPLPADSELYSVPNIIVTPHTSWSSGRVLDRSIDLFCQNLELFRRGEPLLNRVDPNAGY